MLVWWLVWSTLEERDCQLCHQAQILHSVKRAGQNRENHLEGFIYNAHR